MSNPNVERLAAFVRETRKRKHLDQQAVRERGGPATGTLGALEAGTLPNIPKPSTLEKLAKGLGVPLADVYAAAGLGLPMDSVADRGGEGQRETPKPWPLHDLSHSGAGNAGGTRDLESSNDLSKSNHTTVQPANIGIVPGDTGHIMPITADFGPMKRLPVFRVSCGKRILINDQPEEWQSWPVMMTGPVDGIMKVEGNSMLGAGICPGDLIFFQVVNGHRPQPGNTVVAEVDGAAVCKIYQRAPDGSEFLVSAPEDDDKQFFARVGDSVRLVGIVKKHLRDI